MWKYYKSILPNQASCHLTVNMHLKKQWKHISKRSVRQLDHKIRSTADKGVTVQVEPKSSSYKTGSMLPHLT